MMRETRYQNLWELIVNNDDICFKHILPRLNQTDLKFFYGVNTETRKLIKRSSRKGELKGRFKVKEMSSISTLEVAWENPKTWDSSVLLFAHAYKHLECLRYAVEKKCTGWKFYTERLKELEQSQ
jgi:hypothetical protein